MNAAPQTIHLADYQPFGWILQSVRLTFKLDPKATRVTSNIRFTPNPAAKPGPFFLHGENLTLIAARIDGQPVSAEITPEGLTCDVPNGPFTWEAEVEISPETNTALEGLYMSKGMYCTQCEAEGFRKITYYPDRPDVMAPFTVQVKGSQPILLSNGNPTGAGKGWAEWDDPWPKPAYLFALVAGDLTAHSDSFTTKSGRHVDLNVWVRPGDQAACAYAMDSLIRSMKWDEDVYGREYDLDVFNVVAVDDFNMGAMENKGLNIFNSKLVLASPETATDDDYGRIESVIAHEYFHNWTGNRITCRDWFQLCLKEGLTVFRDQQFSADMRSRAVQRIEDVAQLRARQFREDQGPLAHAVRPDSFVEINNFYTATIYEKGAELIGMLKNLVGDEGYAAALDLYFTRHDGDAATIEDWLKVFEDATGRDLTQFKRWYSQAGTPQLKVTDDWANGTYTLHFEQINPPTPGQPTKDPKVLPIAVGLLNPNGDEVLPTTMLEMTEARQSFAFPDLASRPVASILRGFSAPVVLHRQTTPAEQAFLLAHDTDSFNRWEAGRNLARDMLVGMVRDGAAPAADWPNALASLALDDSLDPDFRALALRLPSDDDIAQMLAGAGTTPDPDAIYAARRLATQALADRLAPRLPALITALTDTGAFSPDATAAGRRALKGAALRLMARTDGGATAKASFASASNMTDTVAALSALLDIGQGQPELAAFKGKWQSNALVMDKWFTLQVGLAAPDQAAETTARLTALPEFDFRNPNRFRSVIGAISANHAGFHRADGAGYRVVADWLLKLDPLNPQTAARMSTAFETWARYDAPRQEQAKAQLDRILTTKGLSRDLAEMAARLRKQ